jgi:hypothetical protein
LCEFDGAKMALSGGVIPEGGYTFRDCNVKDSKIEVYGLQLDSGEFTFMECEMNNSRLTIETAKSLKSSIAFSRSKLTNSTVAIRNAGLQESSFYFSGIQIGKGGRVIVTAGVHDRGIGPTLTDSDIHLNDVTIGSGGFLGFQRQRFVRTPLKWDDLELNDAEVAISHSQTESSPISFIDSSISGRSNLVIDIASPESDSVDISALNSGPDTTVSIKVRPEPIDDIRPSAWAQPRSPQFKDLDPALRPYIDTWH